MCRRDVLDGKCAGDLSEAATSRVVETDPLDDALRKRLRPTGRTSSCATARRRDVVAHEALEFVDGDEPLTPRQLDRVDGRNDTAVDGRDAHPERLGGLAARVGETSDLGGLLQRARRGPEGKRYLVDVANVLGGRRRSSPEDAFELTWRGQRPARRE